MRIFYLLPILGLAGCTHLSLSSSHPLWEVHQAHLKTIENWSIQGSIAIATEKDTWNARVFWQQSGPFYQLRFNAPLGQGAMILEGNEDQVTMRTAQNETFVARNPDTLIYQILKLEIPVSGLYSWIRGLPAPAPILEHRFNDHGYLHTLQQNDWYIEYGTYVTVGDFELPKKIFLSHAPFEVKMVISQWQLTAPQEHLDQHL